MNHILKTESENLNFNLSFDSRVILIGSCFSDEMKKHFTNSGINVLSNPFGTLFHPIAIANCMKKAIEDDESVDVYQRDDLFFSWDSSGLVYGNSIDELKHLVRDKRKALKQALMHESLLIVTFGTAWQYELKEMNLVVGNCHKAPQENFQRTLSDSNELSEIWKDLVKSLKQLNPKLKILFTVSPVRHKKDGLVDNNRSKARLIESAHNLVAAESKYFPSYEIVIDELRDYRYYAKDLVHPNEIAVEEVWNRLQSVLYTEEVITIMNRVKTAKSLLNHKSLYEGSNEDEKRIEKANQLKKELSDKYPSIAW